MEEVMRARESPGKENEVRQETIRGLEDKLE
jgi:hypothetical protein